MKVEDRDKKDLAYSKYFENLLGNRFVGLSYNN